MKTRLQFLNNLVLISLKKLLKLATQFLEKKFYWVNYPWFYLFLRAKIRTSPGDKSTQRNIRSEDIKSFHTVSYDDERKSKRKSN